MKSDFQDRVDKLDNVTAITFDAHLETLMAQAAGVVAMGGYNTFCEILSFDKPALIVPRQVPRREQLIRASRAQELGLVSMLTEDSAENPTVMATAMRQLTQQRRPSKVVVPGLLDGLENVNRPGQDAPSRRPACGAQDQRRASAQTDRRTGQRPFREWCRHMCRGGASPLPRPATHGSILGVAGRGSGPVKSLGARAPKV